MYIYNIYVYIYICTYPRGCTALGLRLHSDRVPERFYNDSKTGGQVFHEVSGWQEFLEVWGGSGCVLLRTVLVGHEA